MLESSIPLEPELSKYATLRQAVEWIAFGLEPLIYTYDVMLRTEDTSDTDALIPFDNINKIKAGRQKLYIALKQEKLKATATITKYCLYNTDKTGDYPSYKFFPKDGVDDKYNQDIPLDIYHFEYIDFIKNCTPRPEWYNPQEAPEKKPENHIVSRYTEIKVKTSDLFQLFPPRPKNMKESSLTATEKPLQTREKETLLKIIIGMAIEQYGYDPKATKNKAISDIVADLAEHDLSIDADTIRKKLKEATELLPQKSE